jgi:diadenosine tetraphosphate (Ap4A) HIT family hydrolase
MPESPQACPFCSSTEIVLRNELAFACYDVNPVNPGHLLILPFRHVAGYFEASAEEINGLWSLVDKGKALLDAKFSPHGTTSA